ncbi:hypothetical protein, partial [Paenibacillus camerounensis]|uniref:hypothetical protein n=1 Tax=Paenibacillus camerounensis TaxID=1243663 RepID=UPI001ADFDDA7
QDQTLQLGFSERLLHPNDFEETTFRKLSKRAIAHFETSDENLHSLLLDLTEVISRYSLVVQFSKIKLVVACDYLVSSNSYTISHPVVRCKLFFNFFFRA